MAITSQDVKLFKSERMSDTPDGGGRMTGNEVIDNELNNVFDDTSRLDRVYGRVSLRKVFGAVTTETNEKFLGVHAIITDPPDDGQVSVTIVELNDHNDQREDAKTYVESYLVSAEVTPLTLYDTQPAGARTIIAYVDTQDIYTPPAPNDVIVLSVEKVGDPNFGHIQFVRITDVTSYTLAINQRFKIVYTLDINSPLEISFPGGELVDFPTTANRPTRIRETDLNPVIRYYGVVPLAVQADPGDSVIEVGTILQPVVPASYSESPVLDQQLGPERVAVVKAGPSYLHAVSGLSSGATGVVDITLPRAIEPGSLTVVLDASGTNNDVTMTDAGAGGLARDSGGTGTVNAAGTMTYQAGTISITGLPTSISYSANVTYVPAAAIPDVAHTQAQLIEEPNTGFNYPFVLVPKPAPGTVTATYRALGRWYTLTDNGTGQLVGSPGTGAGTVNYLTGTVNVTTGYQPDVGSAVIVASRTTAHYLEVHASSEVLYGSVQITTAEGIKPGTLTIAWEHASTPYSVTDDGEGNLIGDLTGGEGAVNYAEGFIQFVPSVYPAKLTDFNVTYDSLTILTHTPSPQPTPGPTTVAFTLPSAPLEPGTARIRVAYEYVGTQKIITFVDDGNNVLNITVGGTNYPKGTINYTTGEVVIDKVLNL